MPINKHIQAIGGVGFPKTSKNTYVKVGYL